ncbi:MAG: hypothetical protein AMXMBFR84_16830 [Candidatus Hydrogenedentota bacterium]
MLGNALDIQGLFSDTDQLRTPTPEFFTVNFVVPAAEGMVRPTGSTWSAGLPASWVTVTTLGLPSAPGALNVSSQTLGFVVGLGAQFT